MSKADEKIQEILAGVEPHNKLCKECGVSFPVFAEDLAFYKKILVPLPTRCWRCRNVRRHALRNERTFYQRACDGNGKPIISIYSPDKPYKVYSHEYFWSDAWDGTSFGQEYDPTRSFFEQFHELQLKVPRITTLAKNSENSEYTNQSGSNKNCYMAIEVFDSEDIIHSWFIINSKDCVDCAYLTAPCENCYELVDSLNCYGCFFGQDLKNCTDMFFCFDCTSSKNCILSSNLRNKEYVVRNKQVSKEEFLKVRAELLNNFEEAKVEFRSLLQSSIRPNVNVEKCENCVGNNMVNCKNVYIGFDSYESEDCRYVDRSFAAKDSMDANCYGLEGSNMNYEVQGIVGNWLKFCSKCYNNSFMEYCDNVYDSKYCFGCVGLKHKEYCILNKQYTKEEYEVLVEKIKLDMLARGEYGEFFPESISPFGYNETVAHEYRPLTKEQVVAKGLQWFDNDVTGSYTGPWYEPKEIGYYESNEHTQELLKGVIQCQKIGKPFKVTSQELAFYIKNKLPIPRISPNQRHLERVAMRAERNLWKQSCMCTHSEHDNHKGTSCNVEFLAPYKPGGKETLYCEECYTKEVY